MIWEITGIDLLISFFYILVITFIVRFNIPNASKPYSKYFSIFFASKVLYAFVFVLIHSYYYKGGDTFLYFAGGTFFYDQILENPANFFNLMFSSYENLSNLTYNNTYSFFSSIRSNDVFFMSKIVGIIALLTGGKYLASSILFTMLTGIGIWKLYVTLCKLYPALSKQFAIGIIFYPSLGIWGSGILKDPITFAAVGVIFTACYNLIYRRRLLFSILGILFSVFLCSILKPYILYTFVPIMLLWIQGRLVTNMDNQLFKYLSVLIIIPVFIFGGYLFLQSISEGAGKYSLDNLQSVAEGFHSWHTYLAETRDQSGYSLGNVDFTISGILLKTPEAFFVTYFRPFIIGDVRNFATFFEAIQAFALLIITLYVLLKVGFVRFFRLIVTNSDLRAFMLFAIIFGVTVGITSYNFGALSRYKIPSLPFYTASLAIIYYLGYLKNKNLPNTSL